MTKPFCVGSSPNVNPAIINDIVDIVSVFIKILGCNMYI